MNKAEINEKNEAVEMALARAAEQGNVTAQIFWLKNKKPENWRDKPESVSQGDGALNTLLDCWNKKKRRRKAV